MLGLRCNGIENLLKWLLCISYGVFDARQRGRMKISCAARSAAKEGRIQVSVYRRGDVWWYKFQFGGRMIRESSKSESKTVAKDAERSRRRELET